MSASQACGSSPFILAVSMRVIALASVSPPLSEPAKSQFFRPMPIGRMARSAGLLSMPTRPSSRKSSKDGLGEIAPAWNAQQLGLGPGLEGSHHGAGVLLARSLAQRRRLTGDLALDIVDLADPVEGLPRDLGLRALPNIVEVAPQMRPACCLSELAAAIRALFVERIEAGIGIHLKDATAGL